MNKTPAEIAMEILISSISNDSTPQVNLHNSDQAKEAANTLGEMYSIINKAVVDAISENN